MFRACLVFGVALVVTACGGKQLQQSDDRQVQHQVNDRRDAEIACHMRKAILQDPSMSIEALNLYVRSDAGKLTVRGAVDNDQERTKVRELALKIDGITGISDQMKVLTSNLALREGGEIQ